MKNLSKKSLQIFFLLIVVQLLSSCMPRGETKTIEQVYTRAHDEYLVAVKTANFSFAGGEEIKKILLTLEASLQEFAADTSKDSAEEKKKELQIKPIATKISDNLATLTTSASYTSRPALGEVVQQLEYISQITSAGLSNDQAEIMNPTSRQLLVARIYDLLSSEINGVGFKLKERESKV